VDHDETFTGVAHDEWGLVADSNRSKIATTAILILEKISTTPDWIHISAPNYMGRCIAGMRR